MSQAKKNWFWEIYLYVFLFYFVKEVYYFFLPSSAQHNYYSILRAFNPFLDIFYFLNLTQIILNILCVIMLILLINKRKWLNPNIWQSIFLLRIVFDVLGHPYQSLGVISMHQFNPIIAGIMLGISILLYFPSYLGCYEYSFKMWAPQKNSPVI